VQQNFGHYYRIPGDDTSLTSNSIFAIYKSSDGRLWVGHDGFGFNVKNPGSKSFSRISREDVYGFDANYVQSFHEDLEGQIWIGSQFSGLFKYDEETNRFEQFKYDQHHPNYPGINKIREIAEDEYGNLWLCTFSGLLQFSKRDLTSIQYTIKSGLPGNNVFAVLPEKDGILWVGTTTGLGRYDILTDTWINYFHEPGDSGSLSSSTIYSFLRDSENTLWVGTVNGLNRFNEVSQTFQRITTRNGLSNNVIYAIEEDNSGHIWVSTNKGISRISKNSGKIRNFDKSDGLQEDEFNSTASFKDSDGIIYFGGINGITYFNPDRLQLDVISPIITFTSILANGIATPSLSEPYTISSLELPEDTTNLHIEFAAMDLSANKKVKYRYRLLGFEKDWSQADTKRYVSYTNLSPRDYIFEVQSTDRWGNWQENVTSLRISLIPHFWQTALFQGSLLFFLAGVIVFAYKFRLSLLKKQQQELEDVINEKTHSLVLKNQELEAFSHSVSHDLKSPMYRIHGYSEQIQDELKDQKQSLAYNLASRINDISRQGSELIEDLLSFSRFDYDFVDVHEADISEIALEIVATMRTQDPERNIRIDIQEGLKAYCDVRMIRVLIQNLFANAWKFTQHEEEPRITFGRADNNPDKPFFVRDNGAGFDPEKATQLFTPFTRLHRSSEYKGTGIGLSLARRIVERHEGKIWAEAAPGKGATFFFTLPKEFFD
jgi:signal transduction histidine kinase